MKLRLHCFTVSLYNKDIDGECTVLNFRCYPIVLYTKQYSSILPPIKRLDFEVARFEHRNTA